MLWDLTISLNPLHHIYLLSAPIVGHVGDGNFHSLLLVDVEDPQEVSTAKELTHKMAR